MVALVGNKPKTIKKQDERCSKQEYFRNNAGGLRTCFNPHVSSGEARLYTGDRTQSRSFVKVYSLSARGSALRHGLNPLYQSFIKRQQLFILSVHPHEGKPTAVEALSEGVHTPLFHCVLPRIQWTGRKWRVQELESVCRKTGKDTVSWCRGWWSEKNRIIFF